MGGCDNGEGVVMGGCDNGEGVVMVRVWCDDGEGVVIVRVWGEWSVSSLTIPSVHPPRHCASQASHTRETGFWYSPLCECVCEGKRKGQ